MSLRLHASDQRRGTIILQDRLMSSPSAVHQREPKDSCFISLLKIHYIRAAICPDLAGTLSISSTLQSRNSISPGRNEK